MTKSKQVVVARQSATSYRSKNYRYTPAFYNYNCSLPRLLSYRLTHSQYSVISVVSRPFSLRIRLIMSRPAIANIIAIFLFSSTIIFPFTGAQWLSARRPPGEKYNWRTWTGDYLPDPRSNFTQCGAAEPGLVCDPNRRLNIKNSESGLLFFAIIDAE